MCFIVQFTYTYIHILLLVLANTEWFVYYLNNVIVHVLLHVITAILLLYAGLLEKERGILCYMSITVE